MKTYRLGSTAMVHTPGIIAWAINGYAFPEDQDKMVKIIRETYSGLTNEIVIGLLSGNTPYHVENEAVVFDIDTQ